MFNKMFFMPVIMLGILLLVIAILVFIKKKYGSLNSAYRNIIYGEKNNIKSIDHLSTLKNRLASGEISISEYNILKQSLN